MLALGSYSPAPQKAKSSRPGKGQRAFLKPTLRWRLNKRLFVGHLVIISNRGRAEPLHLGNIYFEGVLPKATLPREPEQPRVCADRLRV